FLVDFVEQPNGIVESSGVAVILAEGGLCTQRTNVVGAECGFFTFDRLLEQGNREIELLPGPVQPGQVGLGAEGLWMVRPELGREQCKSGRCRTSIRC